MNNLLSSLYGFAVGLAIIALILILRFLYNGLNRFRHDPITQERRRRRKVVRDATLLLTSLVFVFAGVAFFNFALFLQTYRTYALGEPIAEVSVINHSEKQEFSVRVHELAKPVSKSIGPLDETFRIHGDQWMLQGHIIRFRSWLNFLGFKPVYQLTRIQGSYYLTEDERKQPRTVYPMADTSTESWWRWIYENADAIPFMEMIQGSAVAQDAKEGIRYIVTVLPSGFSLRKAED